MSVLLKYVPCVFRKMTTRRMAAKRLEEGRVNVEIHPQVEQVLQGVEGDQGARRARNAQVPIVEGGNDVLVVPSKLTDREIREVVLVLTQAMNTHVNRGVETRVNAMESSMTSRLRDFVRMNSSYLSSL